MGRAIRNGIRFLSVAGCLALGGCLAAAERGFDLVLSPEAAGNIARVPYSAVSGLVELLTRFLRG